MNVEFAIKDHEDNLFEYIESKAIECLSNFCQWRLTCIIENVEHQRENDLLEEYSDIVKKQIIEIAPMHAKSMIYNPISMVFNDCKWRYNQFECIEFQKNDNKDGFCFWSVITYKDFEKAGFSQDFVRRVTESLILQKKVKRRRGMGGYAYTLYDFSGIVDRVSFCRESVEFTQFSFEKSDRFSWIFDKYSDEDLEVLFNNERYEVLEAVKEGLRAKDILSSIE